MLRGGWLYASGRFDAQRAHHLVVFVFEDVTVPHVVPRRSNRWQRARRKIEGRDDAGDAAETGVRISGQRLDDVFPGRTLVGGRCFGWADEVDPTVLLELLEVERLTIEDLEAHQMKVNGVCVHGGVVELPDLGRTGLRIL